MHILPSEYKKKEKKCMCMALIKPATGEGMDKSTLVHSQIQIIIFHFLPSPNPSHTQWIINFVLDTPNRLSVPSSHPTLLISLMDNYFLLTPSPFEVDVDLNMDNE
jgi:hypothetical protein